MAHFVRVVISSIAIKIKSFCRTFFKKFVGFRGNAPDGIFKGKALKLPEIIQNLRKQILSMITNNFFSQIDVGNTSFA